MKDPHLSAREEAWVEVPSSWQIFAGAGCPRPRTPFGGSQRGLAVIYQTFIRSLQSCVLARRRSEACASLGKEFLAASLARVWLHPAPALGLAIVAAALAPRRCPLNACYSNTRTLTHTQLYCPLARCLAPHTADARH